MQTLLPHAEKIAALLKRRGESIAVAESTTVALIAAAVLAMPGDSAKFLRAAVFSSNAARALELFVETLEAAR
jgi:nicotinamide mononucleotide (NMN) deamidase PncC